MRGGEQTELVLRHHLAEDWGTDERSGQSGHTLKAL